MAETASIAELKRCLSAYLRQVKPAKRSRSRNEGMSSHASSHIPDPVNARRVRSDDQEWSIRPGTGTLGPEFWDQPRVADRDGLVLKALLDERESGW